MNGDGGDGRADADRDAGSPADGGGDPFTREVVVSALRSGAREMFLNLGRTAKSSVIYETLDYACGLIDPDANVVAQANGVPGFLGTLKFCVRDSVAKFGRDGFEPGDVVLMNDYHGGTHLNDVAMVRPVFADGADGPLLFAASKAHWTDVGGKDPGSWTTDSTSVFQEGVQYPVVKLSEGGDTNDALVDVIAANTRMPEMTLGDMRAQETSLGVAVDRVRDVVDRYGVDTVVAAVDEQRQQDRRRARARVADLPDGTYAATDHIDDDGVTDDPVRVEVEVTIAGETVTVDYTGTEASTAGPINCPYPKAVSMVRAFFQAIVAPEADTGEGLFDPLEVVIPEGTVFHATKPAPIATDWEASTMVADLPWQALAPHLPDRLPAGHFTSVCATIIGGRDERDDEEFLVVEPQPGGWGASDGRDGADVLVCVGDGDTLAMPVEVMEERYPLLFESYRLNTPQEAGHGEFRGGAGLVQEVRLHRGDDGFLTASFGRSKFPPWGMAGGQDGNGNYVELVDADGDVDRRGKVTTREIGPDDLVRLVTSAGGGYGEPTDRDPERVLEDYRDGYLTAETAREVYGVVIDEASASVDRERTGDLRSGTD